MDKRVLKNTLILYARTLITMLIALYTSRVILDVLGVEDYGIYNLVAGIVFLFQSVSSTISGATQRYITYSIGEGNITNIQNVFTASYLIHVILALTVILIGETAGLWFVNNGIIIPEGREFSTNIAYQGALIVFAIDIVNLVWGALIVAYEKMTAYAYIFIIQAILRLANAFLLQWIGVDKLILYAMLELLVGILAFVMFHFYCCSKFEVSRLVRMTDKSLFKEIGSFAGWNFLGASANVFYEQGANILLNHFFSLVLNAARGITGQVSKAVNVFVSNFTIALNPQIIKTYAAGEYEKTRDLVLSGSKLSFYMTLFVAFPLLLNLSYVLNLWLKEVPEYTISFVSLAIICSLFDSYLKPLHCVLFASGNISKYQIVVSLVSIARLPLLWICFLNGLNPEWIYFLIIAYTFFHIFLLLGILNRRNIIPIWDYVCLVLIPTIFIFLICGTVIYVLLGYKCDMLIFIIKSLLAVIGLSLSVYYIGITRQERKSLNLYMSNFARKISVPLNTNK